MIQFHIGPYCDISEIFVFVYRTVVDAIRQTGYTCDKAVAEVTGGVAKSTLL
jgi:hypothetical protein